MIHELIVSFFVIVGASFALIGSIGLARLPDFYSRLHGPTKATTLGVGALLLASVLYFSFHRAGVSLHEVLITLFLFMTAPVSAYLLVRAALFRQVESRTRGPDKEHGHPKLDSDRFLDARPRSEAPDRGYLVEGKKSELAAAERDRNSVGVADQRSARGENVFFPANGGEDARG